MTLPVATAVLLADAPTGSDDASDSDIVGETLFVVVGESVPEPVTVPDGVAVALREDVGVAEGEPLSDLLPVIEGEAPGVRGGVEDKEGVEEAVSVGDEVTVPEPVPVEVGELVGVEETVSMGVTELLRDVLPVLEAEAPVVIDAVGGAECVLLKLCVEVDVCGGVPVPVGVGELEGVAVEEGDGVEAPLRELEPVVEADAPAVKEAVGDKDAVLLLLRVLLGVMDGVKVPLGVDELEAVPEELCVAVPELLRELEPVVEADAPAVKEAVGDKDAVLLLLWVVLAVAFPVPLLEGVAVGVGVGEGVALLVDDEVKEIVPVAEADAPSVMEAVALQDSEELADNVVEGVCEGLGVPVCVGELETVPDPLCEDVREPLNDALPLFEEDAPAVREAVGDMESVLLAVSVEVGVERGELLLVAVGELDGVPVPLCDAVAEPLIEIEPVFDEEAPKVMEAVGDAESAPLPLTVVLDVAFPVPLLEDVAVPEEVADGVTVLVGDAVMEMVPVLEADAPTVTDAVAV